MYKILKITAALYAGTIWTFFRKGFTPSAFLWAIIYSGWFLISMAVSFVVALAITPGDK